MQTTVADPRPKWLVVPKPNPAASVRLLCFASAGHGPSMFRNWSHLTGPDLELMIAQLPGRESRWNEPPFVSLTDLVPALATAVTPWLDRPFAMFGHSLGALVAFELARRVRADRGVGPIRLFASAHRAPQLPNRHPRISHLTDREFIAQVNGRHGGIPDAVASNQELMDLMLPSLRADYRVFEDYQYTEQEPLSCPITAFGGTGDVYVTADDLQPWGRQTAGEFRLCMLDGGHFFVNDLRDTVVSIVVDEIARARV